MERWAQAAQAAKNRMSYRLGRNESAAAGTRRVLLEQLDEAIDNLEGRDEHDHDERIHDARRCLKKARAVLRLVRPVLGEEAYRRENACFRDAALELGGARRGAALLECFEGLCSTYAGELPPDVFAGTRRLLLDLREHAVGDALERGVDDEVAETLRIAAHRSASWTLDADGFEALEGGLGRTYARGRKAFDHAYAEPSTESFHEWRKRVKYHWYHVRLLTDVWPKPMKARQRSLKQLADLLGDDHDLGELRDVLRGLPPHLAADLRVDRLLLLIDHQEHRLRSQARHIGRRIYAEQPKQLVRRFGGYFTAWVAHSASPPASPASDGDAGESDLSTATGRNTST